MTIEIIQTFIDFISLFHYGYKRMRWDKETKKIYKTLSPDEFLQDTCGVCTDYAAFIKDQFEKAGLVVDEYVLVNNIGGKTTIHALAVAKLNEEFIIPDPCTHPKLAGLYRRNNLYEFFDEYIVNMKKLLREEFNLTIDSVKIYKVEPLYGLTRDEWLTHIQRSEQIW